MAIPGTSVLAQATDEPSATVKVQPEKIAPGGAVTISGIGYLESSVQLIITVSAPGGAKSNLTALPDSQGRYSTPYFGAQAPGSYEVSAQAGAKGVPAKTHFTVESSFVDIDEDVADNKAFLEKGIALVKAVRNQVVNTPDSPAKTEMLSKLDKLEPALQKVSQQAQQLAATLTPIKTLLAQHPEVQPTLQPMLDHLDQLDQKVREQQPAVDQETAAAAKTMQACDSIDHAVQALGAVTNVLDYFHEPFEFVTGYLSNLAKSRLPAAAGGAADATTKAVNLAHGIANAGESKEGLEEATSTAKGTIVENGIELGAESALGEKLADSINDSVRNSEGFKLAVREIKKFAPRVVADQGNLMHLVIDAAALTTDIATFAEQRYFARYCEKFEGPFSATMTAYFFAKGYDQDWWHYNIVVKGKFTLRYPKDASGHEVPLSGQFEGAATHFGYGKQTEQRSVQDRCRWHSP
jgi:hypothetical protein